MTDLYPPPTGEEHEAAARRYNDVVGRGQRLVRRRRVIATAGAGIAMFGIALAVVVALPGKKSALNVNVVSPPTTAAATTAPPTTAPPTTAPPATANPSGGPAAQLDAYLADKAAKDSAAANSAGQPWNGFLHTAPIADAGHLVAVAAFSYDPDGKPLRVIGYAHSQWTELAALGAPPDEPYVPPGAAMNSYWLAYFPGAAISLADITGDGRPDFLVPLNAADTVPGVIVSEDGAPSRGWRYVPYTTGASSKTSYEFARDAQLRANKLVTTYDNCKPNCAQGTNSTMTWTYKRGSGAFWAPSPSN